MKYIGKLSWKIGRKIVPLGRTSEDWDSMESEIESLRTALATAQAENEKLKRTRPTHRITAGYYPDLGEVELSWEDVGTHEVAIATFLCSDKVGSKIAQVIPPLVQNYAIATQNRADREDTQ